MRRGFSCGKRSAMKRCTWLALLSVRPDALAECVEIAAAFIQRTSTDVAIAEIHRVAAGLQVYVHGGDAARGHKIGIQMQAAAATRLLAQALCGHGQAIAFAKDRIPDGDPHQLLRSPIHRGPAAPGGVGGHRGARFVARGGLVAMRTPEFRRRGGLVNLLLGGSQLAVEGLP